MIRFNRYCSLSLLVLFVINTVSYAETFWERRKKAYENLQSGGQQQGPSSAVTSRTGTPTKKNTSAYAFREDFGNKKIKKFSSTEQFRNPYNLTIPVEFGEVRETFVNKEKPLIVNLQDYHCNYQAQKQIANILDDLIVNAGLKLILVEGNSKDASLKHLRSMASRQRRIEVAEDYLKRGMISGEEYLDIISDYDFKALGIEDRKLYMQNLDSFLEIDKFREEALKIIDSFKSVIENLKPLVYSERIQDIDQKRKLCDAGKMQVADYGDYLLKLAQENRANISFPHENFDRVKQVAQMDKEINFGTVNKERDSLIADLSKNLNEEELARLLFKSTEFKNKRIAAHDFHNYLLQLPYAHIKEKYPLLHQYIMYLNVHANVDVLELFNEIDHIEDVVKEEYFKNDDERQLSKLARNVQILSGYFALELIPAQYVYFKAHPEEFRILEWQSFLDRLVRSKGLSKTVPQDVSLIQDKMTTVDDFYILAKQRDGIFLEKIKKYIEQENADVCALVTGGFHSTNLAKMFYDAGYSYITVLPMVTEITDEKLYHSVLKYKTDLMKKAQNNQ